MIHNDNNTILHTGWYYEKIQTVLQKINSTVLYGNHVIIFSREVNNEETRHHLSLTSAICQERD